MRKANRGFGQEDNDERDQRRIQRVNELSDGAKSVWLALVGYLTFCGITLLAVEDVDFFLQVRQTDLPLIGVSIPTKDFFIFGPILATALYIYFHINIMKLWKEASRPRPRLKGEALAFYIRPWLISDLALRVRGDGPDRARLLDYFSLTATFFLVFLLGPIIVGYFWIRYWPAHDLYYSLLSAGLLCLTLSTMFVSFKLMVISLRQLSETRGRVYKLLEFSVGTLIFIIFSLITVYKTDAFQIAGFEKQYAFVDGKWRDYLVLPEEEPPVEPIRNFDRLIAHMFVDVDLSNNIFFQTFNLEIARANLSEAVLTPLPNDWLPYHVHKQRFRASWCSQKGIDSEVCGLAPYSDSPATSYLSEYTQRLRVTWCVEERRGIPIEKCFDHFRELDSQFINDWRAERTAKLISLQAWSPRNIDLRNADLTRASMPAADLRFADLVGATLEGANLEGADLSGAAMSGADLSKASLPLSTITCEPSCQKSEFPGVNIRFDFADLELAYLQSARMRGVNFREASMGGIDLSGAVLRSGILDSAALDDADLRDVDFSWASLKNAQLNNTKFKGSITENSNLSGASFGGTDFGHTNVGPAIALGANFSNVEDLEQVQINDLVGNEATLLPAYPDARTGAPLHVWTCTDHYSGVPDLYAISRLWGISEDAIRNRQIPWYCQFGNSREKAGTPVGADYAPSTP